MPSAKSTFDGLRQQGWTLPDAQEHPLGSLQGESLDSYRLVVLLGAKNKIGARYFQVFLQSTTGEVSQQPVIIGLHNRGRYPSYNWIEVISLATAVNFDSAKEGISTGRLEQKLLQQLADLIPPGGHLMAEYESLRHRVTAGSLSMGIPPAVTPLGYTLFSVGCGTGFRDWHFAEGGAEGPRKLQGYKALNTEHARLKARQLEQELTVFLDAPYPDSEMAKAARHRAQLILSKLCAP